MIRAIVTVVGAAALSWLAWVSTSENEPNVHAAPSTDGAISSGTHPTRETHAANLDPERETSPEESTPHPRPRLETDRTARPQDEPEATADSSQPNESVLRHLRRTEQSIGDWIRYRDALASLSGLRADSVACAVLDAATNDHVKIEHWSVAQVFARSEQQPNTDASSAAIEEIRTLMNDLRARLAVDPVQGGGNYALRAAELERAFVKLSSTVRLADDRVSIAESALQQILGPPHHPYQSYLSAESSLR